MGFIEILVIIIMLSLILYFIIDAIKVYNNHIVNKNRDGEVINEVVNERTIAKEGLKSKISELSDKYGKCTVDINLGNWTDHTIDKRLLVFKDSNIVIINNTEYKFSDILGFSMIDNSTKETTTFSEGSSSTSTRSMLGRTIVGGVVGGGLGAVAGAATAKRNNSSDSFSETKTKHRYIIYINLNSFENPTLKLPVIEGSDKAQNIANILNVIIERNKKNV